MVSPLLLPTVIATTHLLSCLPVPLGPSQMVSLLHLAEITEEGVTFQSPTDGSTLLLTPEMSMGIQNRLGACVGGGQAGGMCGARGVVGRGGEGRWHIIPHSVTSHNMSAVSN